MFAVDGLNEDFSRFCSFHNLLICLIINHIAPIWQMWLIVFEVNEENGTECNTRSLDEMNVDDVFVKITNAKHDNVRHKVR